MNSQARIYIEISLHKAIKRVFGASLNYLNGAWTNCG
jgi:hypothetical protein